jgi:type I restriction-modification system DNA methylase subunit
MAKTAKAKKEVTMEEALWKSADKLRGSVEPAEYKHVVLSLFFLKFASDKFEAQRKIIIEKYGEKFVNTIACNGVQREHNKKLNNGLPILHKVPPKRDYGRYFCIMAEKGGTSHGGLTEKLSLFFHAKKQEVNAYGR